MRRSAPASLGNPYRWHYAVFINPYPGLHNMLQQFDFPSVSRPTIRYRVSRRYRDNEDYRNVSSRLCSWLKEFDTMGDGNVQHTPDSNVWRDNATDALESLAAALVPFDRDKLELVTDLQSRDHVPVDYVLFLAALRPIPETDEAYTTKTRRFSRTERKVSTSDSKRHDKRWDEVPRFADGSYSAVVGMMQTGSNFLFDSFGTYREVERIMDEHDLRFGQSATTHFKLPYEFGNAFYVVSTMLNAFRDVKRCEEFAERMKEQRAHLNSVQEPAECA